MDYDSEKLKRFGIMVVLSIIIHVALIILAIVFCRSKKEEDKSLDCLDKMGVVMTNCGFVGIPLIQGVFGSEGVFYLLGFITTFNVVLWTFGYFIMTGKVNLKKILTNPNIISVVLGIVIFILPFNLPEIITKPVSFIGSMNTAMAMILLGLLFANFKKNPDSNYTKRLVKVCLLRHVASALLVFVIVYFANKIFSNIPDIRTMCFVAFIAALCPTGMSVSSFAVVFEKDESYAALICMVTSVICVVTLPLSVALAGLAI